MNEYTQKFAKVYFDLSQAAFALLNDVFRLFVIALPVRLFFL